MMKKENRRRREETREAISDGNHELYCLVIFKCNHTEVDCFKVRKNRFFAQKETLAQSILVTWKGKESLFFQHELTLL